MTLYTGYRCFNFNDKELLEFYADPQKFALEAGLLENEYVLTQMNGAVIDCYSYKKGKMAEIKSAKIKQDTSKSIQARNPEQKLAIDMLLDDSIPVKVLTGGYGVGKDYLMVNAAFEKIKAGIYQKIVYVRNNIEVKDTGAMGCLPG